MKIWRGFWSHHLQKPHSFRLLSLTITITLVGLLSACGGAATQSDPAEPPGPVDETQQVEAAQPEAAPQETEPVAEVPEAETVEPTAKVEAPAQVDPVAEEEQPLESTVEAEVEDVAQVEPTTEVEPEVVAEPPAPRPLDQLIATDPATVSLASGQVQLVEFFAFW